MKLLDIIKEAAFKKGEPTHRVVRFEMVAHHASIRSEVFDIGEDYVTVKDTLGKEIHLYVPNIVSVSFVDSL